MSADPLIAPSGQLAGRPLEEWNAAYAKVESYFHALRVRNKALLGQLVLRVLERAMRRAPAEPNRSATQLAAEEMDQLVIEWFAEVLQSPPTERRPDAFHARTARAAARRYAGQMAGTISAPGPWPQEFAGAMRETFLRAGPDFQISKMTPRAFDLGPITTLTNLRTDALFSDGLWPGRCLPCCSWLSLCSPTTADHARQSAANFSSAHSAHPPRLAAVSSFFPAALLLTGIVSMLFADLLWRTGWSASRTFLLVLFVILFLLAASAAFTAFMDLRCESSARAAASRS